MMGQQWATLQHRHSGGGGCIVLPMLGGGGGGVMGVGSWMDGGWNGVEMVGLLWQRCRCLQGLVLAASSVNKDSYPVPAPTSLPPAAGASLQFRIIRYLNVPVFDQTMYQQLEPAS